MNPAWRAGLATGAIVGRSSGRAGTFRRDPTRLARREARKAGEEMRAPRHRAHARGGSRLAVAGTGATERERRAPEA
jgi:hypothetical protein